MKKNVRLIIIFLLLISFIIYKALSEDAKLMDDFQVGVGVIIGVETFRNSDNQIFVKFVAKIDDKDITSKTGINCSKSNKSVFEIYLTGKRLDIIYEKNNPDNCKMLLARNSYEKFKLMPSKESVIILDSIESICNENSTIK